VQEIQTEEIETDAVTFVLCAVDVDEEVIVSCTSFSFLPYLLLQTHYY
jgi:hypothetical protein